MKREDLTNKQFGELTPIKLDLKRKERTFWICHCSCGNKKSVAAKHLKNGSIITCNAAIHSLGQNNKNWKGFQEISQKQWWTIKRHATNRELGFHLTKEQAWDKFLLQGRKCALSNLDLTLIGEHGGRGNASLDRIDSSKGYTLDNVQWVDKRLNKMKMDLNESEFFELCKLVILKHESSQ